MKSMQKIVKKFPIYCLGKNVTKPQGYFLTHTVRKASLMAIWQGWKKPRFLEKVFRFLGFF